MIVKNINSLTLQCYRKFSSVATIILNFAFLSAGTRIQKTIQNLNSAIECSINQHELMVFGKAHNYLKFVKAQYKLLRAVVWRYTHPPKKPKFIRLCFYGGVILNDLDEILRTAIKTPGQLLDKGGSAIIFNFGALCKKFMSDFERISEREVNSKTTCASG